MFPRINDAFARPLHQLDAASLQDHILSQTQTPDDPDTLDDSSALSTDTSVMDVSSLSDSSSGADLISVDSYYSNE